MYSLYLHVMDGGHFQACGASPWNSSLQELTGGRSTLGARHLRPSRLSESAVRTTTWSPAAVSPLLLPSPVTTGCTNNLLARAQKIMERVGRGGTQGAGGAGGGGASYDQALKSLNEQWLQMRFTTRVSGSELAVLKLSHRKFLAPGGLAKIKSQEDVFDVVVYGVTLCAMFLATPRHTALQRLKAQAKVERGALHTHVALLNNGTTVVSLLDFNGAGNMFSTVRQEHGIRLEDLKLLPKVLFDLFPTYYSSPLLTAFDQILQKVMQLGSQVKIWMLFALTKPSSYIKLYRTGHAGDTCGDITSKTWQCGSGFDYPLLNNHTLGGTPPHVCSTSTLFHQVKFPYLELNSVVQH
ncbi:hypothetical protein BDL97_03G065100 [Sphagnum fallax]|nr:hypothetical protein BDL97_03G065100 [Sphagnum fallax]